VKDTVEAAIKMAANHSLAGEIINIGSGHDYSILWLVKEIQKLMNNDAPIVFSDPRPGDVHRHIANVLKAKDLLGFEHTTSMDEGLKTTIEWYMDR
jgi:nucleoside-diphosphate-sugar epimerase